MWLELTILAVLALLVYGYRIPDRLRLRHIPAAPFGVWMLGQLAAFRHTPMYKLYQDYAQRWGSVYLIFIGKEPVVIVTDPEIARDICVKRFSKFHDRPQLVSVPASRDKRLRLIQSGLLVAKGGYWASLRSAIAPLFHSAALQGYVPVMHSCIGHLLDRLGEEGAKGKAADVHELAGSMTLEVIGRTAFGVDLQEHGGSSHEEQEAARRAGRPNLPAALRIIFGGALTPGGGGLVFRLTPQWAEPYVFHLLFRMVGQMGKAWEYARTTLCLISGGLLANAAQRAREAGQPVTMRETDWKWWDKSLEPLNPYKDAVPARGSVLDSLLRAVNKETGQGLADYQIVTNSNTLIAAGFETTANALAFTLYLLSKNPEAAERLREEVDTFGQGQMPTYEDLHRFPWAAACIDEATRLYPPVHTVPRVATDDCVVGIGSKAFPDGLLIPRGTWVHLGIWTMHHDPLLWPDPEAYKPERFLEAPASSYPGYWAFGAGPRDCVGKKFALEELALSLIRLYQAFTFELDSDHHPAGQPLGLKMGLTISPKDGVWLRTKARG